MLGMMHCTSYRDSHYQNISFSLLLNMGENPTVHPTLCSQKVLVSGGESLESSCSPGMVSLSHSSSATASILPTYILGPSSYTSSFLSSPEHRRDGGETVRNSHLADCSSQLHSPQCSGGIVLEKHLSVQSIIHLFSSHFA